MQTMAKKRATRKGIGGRPKGPDPQRKVIAAFKGSEAFAAWMAGLVDHCRAQSGWADLPAAAVIEKALVCYANEVGYVEVPPKR
jgi:hypothetical protein